jgi:hypothetical protein
MQGSCQKTRELFLLFFSNSIDNPFWSDNLFSGWREATKRASE